MTSDAPTLLRRAADCVECHAIGDRKERAIRLIALHIIRVCGSDDVGEETKLLLEYLEE